MIAHAMPGLTVLDLFETGGELLALRRREVAKHKGSDTKTLLHQIENATDVKWKGRLLELIKLLCLSLVLGILNVINILTSFQCWVFGGCWTYSLISVQQVTSELDK